MVRPGVHSLLRLSVVGPFLSAEGGTNMRLVFSVVLAILLLGVMGCGLSGAGSSCQLDTNGDGQLTEADIEGLTDAQIDALAAQIQANPLSLLPCMPMLEAAAGTMPSLGV
jgi:hypothetical protein